MCIHTYNTTMCRASGPPLSKSLAVLQLTWLLSYYGGRLEAGHITGANPLRICRRYQYMGQPSHGREVIKTPLTSVTVIKLYTGACNWKTSV